MDSAALRSAFLATLPSERRAAFDRVEVERTLAALVERGRAAWPDVALAPTEFVAHLGARLRPHAPAGTIDEVCAGDLWLACACARGDAAAVRAFETAYVGEIDRMLGRMRLDADVLAEAKQQVRAKLLVGAAPRIAEYSGRGELRAWLHAVATRTALNVLRARRRELRAGDAELMALPAAADDPEMRVLRQRHAADFKAAFGDALGSLTARQRLLIKRHFVDGLGTDQLGALYHVHRVTVLRWLTSTRELLAKRTQEALWRRLGLQRAEFESIVRLVRSQLDFSIRELLG